MEVVPSSSACVIVEPTEAKVSAAINVGAPRTVGKTSREYLRVDFSLESITEGSPCPSHQIDNLPRTFAAKPRMIRQTCKKRERPAVNPRDQSSKERRQLCTHAITSTKAADLPVLPAFEQV